MCMCVCLGLVSVFGGECACVYVWVSDRVYVGRVSMRVCMFGGECACVYGWVSVHVCIFGGECACVWREQRFISSVFLDPPTPQPLLTFST